MSNRFRQALEAGDFTITCEMIPGRGAREDAQAREFEHALAIYATGRVHAITITDNPSGNPALLADGVGGELAAAGVVPLVHFTCKDRNRNQLLSQLYAMERGGIENLLVMTGDYQSSGHMGLSRPVFDLDSVQLLQMIAEMNEGLRVQGPRGESCEKPAHFFMGAAVNPFKYREGEVIPQYLKMEKKIVAGADFVVSQLGYDARKMQELVRYVRECGYDTPLIANIFLTSKGAAKMMRRGDIAGCHISDAFLARLEEESLAEDKDRGARIERAAQMVALAKGLGYSGAHIGGIGLTADMVVAILDRADELAGCWESLVSELSFGEAEGFYLYETDSPVPGIAVSVTANAPDSEEAAFGVGAEPAEAVRACDANRNVADASVSAPALQPEDISGRKLFGGYRLSRFFHYWVLTQGKRLYPLLEKAMDRREKKKGARRKHGFEHLGKTMLYGCVDCGDCGLEACVYSCPMAACPKSQRNGPCGGSADGWCEVYPQERFCIHYKAYHRLKRYGELEKMTSYITPPNAWELNQTSSWGNYTHGRDNIARRMDVSIGHPTIRKQ